jgi:hypothetical protein
MQIIPQEISSWNYDAQDSLASFTRIWDLFGV